MGYRLRRAKELNFPNPLTGGKTTSLKLNLTTGHPIDSRVQRIRDLTSIELRKVRASSNENPRGNAMLHANIARAQEIPLRDGHKEDYFIRKTELKQKKEKQQSQ